MNDPKPTDCSPITEPSATANTQPPGKRLFTRENASQFGRIGAAKRKEAIAALKAAAARKDAIAELEPEERYRLNSLSRTRALIVKLESKLEKSGDDQGANYLASALAKLRDIEQKLAMRPSPGSHRPKPPAKGRAAGSLGPIDSET